MTSLRHRPILAAALVGTAVGALVAATWTVARPDPEAPLSAAAGTTSTEADATDAGPRATQAELDAEVAELLEFITEARGLEFEAPVEVELQGDDEFLRGVLEQMEGEGEELEGVDETLVALGLVEPGFDLREELEAAAESSVVGYYDAEADTLFVRGTQLTPFVRITLVHELVHALQDQHFGLDRFSEIEDDEANASAQALVEGDAEYVAQEFILSLPLAEQAHALGEAAGFVGAGAEIGDETDDEAAAAGPEDAETLDVLDAVLGFPYVEGPSFVAALIEEADDEDEPFDLVDDAYRRPPRSTEQILHPDRYLAGEVPLDVAAPEVSGEIVDEGNLGEFLLTYLLDPQLRDDDAFEAADGWGGDAYVTSVDGDRVTTAVRFIMDSAKDRDELLEALQEWARDHGTASVREDGRAVVLEAAATVGATAGERRGGGARWTAVRPGG